jgi:hypothetical protein
MQPLTDFSGGLWLPPGDPDSATPQPGFAVPPNALLQAENVEYLPSGGLRGRRGTRRRFQVADPIIGLWRHYPRPGLMQASASPSAAATTGAGTAWTNLIAYAADPDGQPASCAFAAEGTSQFLDVTGFGFAVDPAAVITGLAVRIVRHSPNIAPTVRDRRVVLLQAGAVPAGMAEHSVGSIWPGFVAAGAPAPLGIYKDYGGPGDLWGLAWTPADLNAAAFGLRLQVEAFEPFSPPPNAEALVYRISVAVFLVSDDAPSVLIASAAPGGTLYAASIADGTLGFAAQLPQAGSRPHFVTWPEQGATFVFDGVNAPQRYRHDDGQPTGRRMDSFASPAGVTVKDAAGQVLGVTVATPRGPYATLWQNRLWAVEPTELGFSVYACEVNDPGTWLSDVQLSANDPGGGRLTGITAVPSAPGVLLILKDTALFAFTGDPVLGGQFTRFCDQGCIAPDTVAATPHGVIYLGREGLYLTDGQSPLSRELSEPIQALFRTRTGQRQYPNAVGGWYPRGSRYVLKLDPDAPDGWVVQFIAATSGALGLPALNVAWAHLPVVPLSAVNVWIGAKDDGQLMLGGGDGIVREADTGAVDDDGTEAGQMIPVVLRTMAHPLDDRGPLLREGRVAYVKPSYRGSAGLAGVLRFDSDLSRFVAFSVPNGTALAYHNARATITDLRQFGRVVDVALASPEGPDFELHRIGLDVQLRSVRQWR